MDLKAFNTEDTEEQGGQSVLIGAISPCDHKNPSPCSPWQFSVSSVLRNEGASIRVRRRGVQAPVAAGMDLKAFNTKDTEEKGGHGELQLLWSQGRIPCKVS